MESKSPCFECRGKITFDYKLMFDQSPGKVSMKSFKIESFTKGWLVGNFTPALYETPELEVGVKHFTVGEKENSHMQIVATEISVVAAGRVRLGPKYFQAGDIVVISPGEVADFESITDSIVVCIKFPSIPNDKVIVSE